MPFLKRHSKSDKSPASAKPEFHSSDATQVMQAVAPNNDPGLPTEFIAARKRAKRNKYLKRGAIAGVVVIAIAGTFAFSQQNNEPTEAPTTQSYTQAVEKGTLSLSIEGSGTLAAASTTNENASVSGTVKKVYVSEGDSVSKGDTLFTLTSDTLSDAVTDAKKKKSSAYSSYSEAKSSLAKAKKSLTKAKKAATKAKKAAAKAAKSSSSSNQGSNSSSSSDSASSQLSEATSAVQSAQEEVTKATESVSSTKTSYEEACDTYNDAVDALDDLTVSASADGTVTAVNISAGDTLDSNSTDAAITTSDTSTMTLSVNVSEYDIGKIKKKQNATVTVTALDKSVSATVSNISSTANDSSDGSTAYYPVTLTIKKPTSAMLVGMNASTTITYKEYTNTLLVPTSAVSTQGDTSTVTVQADDGSTSQVEVEVQGSDDETTAVKSSSLSEGDLVVVNYQVNTDSSDTSQGGDSAGIMGGLTGSQEGGSAPSGNPGSGGGDSAGGQGGNGGGQGSAPSAPSGNGGAGGNGGSGGSSNSK